MPILVNDLVDACREAFDDLTATKVIAELNRIRPGILADFNQGQALATISLVAGQREYALATSHAISEVRYARAAGTEYRLLIPRSYDEMLYENPEWEKTTNAEPAEYYVRNLTTGNVIGINPPPASSTSGTYPRLEIQTVTVTAAVSGGTLYEDMPSLDLYRSLICLAHARNRRPEAIAIWTQAAENARQEVHRYISNKQRTNKGTRPTVGWLRGSRANY